MSELTERQLDHIKMLLSLDMAQLERLIKGVPQLAEEYRKEWQISKDILDILNQ